MSGGLRVAIVADYPEEGWPSMDLVARMVADHLERGHAGEVEVARVCPPFRRRFGRLPGPPSASRNADRLLNRHADYPRFLRRLARRDRFDVYHVVDHSYAQLALAVPPGRAVVTCHDVDTFRCLIGPDPEPRPAWFRAMVRRTLRGLRAAAAVPCVSAATRRDVLDAGLVPEPRLCVVPNGTGPEFFEPPGPAAEAEADRLAGPAGPADLLHVGTTIPRKRIDVLLDVFAGVRRAVPGARLIKAGGSFTPEQEARARALGVLDAIRVVPRPVESTVLAALYRRAGLVLQPSESEGFGLPLAEAMACGAPLLVSELPVLREVAGEAAAYRPVGDVDAWVAAALALLDDRGSDAWYARRAAGITRAATYRWEAHAARLVDLYREVAGAIGG